MELDYETPPLLSTSCSLPSTQTMSLNSLKCNKRRECATYIGLCTYIAYVYKGNM